jgi:hypothetical protein
MLTVVHFRTEVQHIVSTTNQRFSFNHMKNIVLNILTILFPFKELNERPSVFIQDTWLEKIMRPTQVKDYLWRPSSTR